MTDLGDTLKPIAFMLAGLIAGGIGAWRWRWRGATIAGLVGVVGFTSIWAILSLGQYLETGPSSPQFKFALGAGLMMFVGPWSMIWLLSVAIGALLGAVGRWAGSART